jgi:hypothetical protein
MFFRPPYFIYTAFYPTISISIIPSRMSTGHRRMSNFNIRRSHLVCTRT